MFKSKLAFNDFDSPLDCVNGGIFLGGSTILPVSHRLLHTVVLQSEDRVAVVSSERFSDDPPGLRIESGLSDTALRARLDAAERHILDFAILVIDRRSRAVRYTASPVVAIPAYLIADRDTVSIDWDYARLLAGRSAGIEWDIALAQIAGLSSYGSRTVVTGVHRATAGATLVATPSGVEAHLPEPVAHDGPHEIEPGADIEAMLFDTVVSLIAARPLDPTRTAVELSGGMDSALTALAAAEVAGRRLMSIGAQFGGAMGEAQRGRRLLLCQNAGFDDLSVPAERFAPFSSASLRRTRYGVWPEDENYPELFEAMFGMLRAAGIDTLISGFGGDELYFAYEGEEPASAAEPLPCPFLTAHGAEIAAGARSAYPQGWLQQSCWQSAASQSQRVLRYGLWPVHPYQNPALARFVSRLPYAYRRNRRVLRQALTRRLGVPVFETDYVKESFDAVAQRGMIENRDYLIDLVRGSRLSAHSEINDTAILAALSGDIGALERGTFQALFRALKLYCFFQSGD